MMVPKTTGPWFVASTCWIRTVRDCSGWAGIDRLWGCPNLSRFVRGLRALLSMIRADGTPRTCRLVGGHASSPGLACTTSVAPAASPGTREPGESGSLSCRGSTSRPEGKGDPARRRIVGRSLRSGWSWRPQSANCWLTPTMLWRETTSSNRSERPRPPHSRRRRSDGLGGPGVAVDDAWAMPLLGWFRGSGNHP